MAAGTFNFKYTASPTLKRFHACDDMVRCVIGPVGSGKSSGCMVEGGMIRAMKQEADPLGYRRTRGAIIRNTYTELSTTSLKTFKDWYGYDICSYRADKPLSANIHFTMPDGTKVDCEVIFLALDRDEDVGKIRSLELTWAYINEASEIESYGILDALRERVGRYPKQWEDPKTGLPAGGPTWSGIFIDTNAPDDEHWIYEKFEQERPEGFRIFHQPPAVLLADGSDAMNPVWVPNKGQREGIPAAENLEHLGKVGHQWDYYLNMLPGKPYEAVRTMLGAEYGIVAYGRPVYTKYNDQVFFMPNRRDPKTGRPMDVELLRGYPVMIGFDFGIEYAAAVFAQLGPMRQLRVFDELVVKDTTTRDFGNMVAEKCHNEFPGMLVYGYGDPAGNARGRQEGISDINILNECGIPTEGCVTNIPKQRIEAVNFFMGRMVDTGMPGLVLGSKCKWLRKGFAGRYHYKKVSTTARDATYKAEPVKDKFSHPHDALQYIAAQLMYNENARNAAQKVRTTLASQAATDANLPVIRTSCRGC